MRLQLKFSLYNAVTKIAIIFFLGTIILFSLDRIANKQFDNRLLKKQQRIIENLSDWEIKSLLNDQTSFTDYNFLKEEFIILTEIPDFKGDSLKHFITDKREIEGNIETYRILSYNFYYHKQWYKLELGEIFTTLQAIKSNIRFYMLIVLIISLLITLFADYFFAKIILNPFYQIINKKINLVNDPSHFNYDKIPTNTRDFKILDESINTLMYKLNEYFLQEKQFIANVSHELLTPISVLSTRFENMLNTQNIPIEHEDKIFASLKTLNRLKLIINSLLLISKVENNQYLKTESINLANEIRDIEEDFEDRIASKQISFNVEVDNNFNFTGNNALIHTLLTNLINNAIKYNKIAGSIHIKSAETASGFELIISDTGQGMNKELLDTIFNRFKRGETEEQGFGLGLAIVESISKFHNIKLEVTSVEHVGTDIKLIFPYSD